MSGSGDEVDLDNEHGKAFHWSKENVKKMVGYIQSKLPEQDIYLAPYNSVEIDWDEVEDVTGIEASKCQHKWKVLLNTVRTYRTMPEILTDILEQNAKLAISKHNKSQKAQQDGSKNMKKETENSDQSFQRKSKRKKIVNPDHPTRPKVNGYSVFCSKVMKEVTNTGMKGVHLMLKLGTMWKELSDSERAVYNAECMKEKEEYLSKVQEYAREHPDDAEIQKVLADEIAKAKSGKSKKGNETKADISVLAHDNLDDTVSSASSSILTPRKSPKKKKHDEDSELSQVSSPKKRKKKEKLWTAERVYIENKFDAYKEEHSDLDDEEINNKLTRKFNKMSDDKKAKYRRKAEERNG